MRVFVTVTLSGHELVNIYFSLIPHKYTIIYRSYRDVLQNIFGSGALCQNATLTQFNENVRTKHFGSTQSSTCPKTERKQLCTTY